MRFVLLAVLLGIAAAPFLPLCRARRHHLEVRDDFRRYIALSTFGFYQGGILDVRFSGFRVPAGHQADVFGLSLDKTMTDAMNPYLDSHQDRCILDERAAAQRSGPIVFFVMDLRQNKVNVSCSRDWPQAFIYKTKAEIVGLSKQPKPYETNLFAPLRRRRSAAGTAGDAATAAAVGHVENKCSHVQLELISVAQPDGSRVYSMNFVMWIPTKDEEGLYNLYFHACPNYAHLAAPLAVALAFNVDIEESNRGSFLSAGEMPLPALYFMMAILFLLSGLFWVFILRKSRHTVFKIHYIMAGLVFLKALSLLFHSINYHFIEVLGEHVETWAILFYIAHLLKGAVLFITIVLIGTGYTFIKHILSDKDKRLFMIVIPLQILANIAQIILAEGEEGDKEHRTWTHILYFVDLLCCGAILFPVVWSIRHLQEASRTDGKAATNLRKLKLFRQFYIMIVCYIYVTRIVAYLLRITVPFQYGWLDEMFREMATYVFFVLTAYKFRPTGTHPYFAVNADDEEFGDDDADDAAGAEDGVEGGGGDGAIGMKKSLEAESRTRSGLNVGLRHTKSAFTRNLLVPAAAAVAAGVTAEATHLPAAASDYDAAEASDQSTVEDYFADDLAADDDAEHLLQRQRSSAAIVERARLMAKRESSHEYD